jgi:hypothetical protein
MIIFLYNLLQTTFYKNILNLDIIFLTQSNKITKIYINTRI